MVDGWWTDETTNGQCAVLVPSFTIKSGACVVCRSMRMISPTNRTIKPPVTLLLEMVKLSRNQLINSSS